jgi:hypothetical protein
MKTTIRCAAAAAILAALAWPSPLLAQDNAWTGGAAGNWTDATWTQFGVPDPLFDQRAIVGSTVGSASTTGVVNVTTDIRTTNPAPSVVLGENAGASGTLSISSTGKFRVVNADLSAGNFDVGLNGGTGVLNVASGGVVEVARELRTPTNANAASTISLAGTASVTAATGFFDKRLIVDGPSVNFSTTGNVVFGQAGTHTWRIQPTGASALKVGGNADLGGTLRLEFPGGTPTVGSTWNLIDSDTVDVTETTPSGFNAIDQSAVTGLAAGAKFTVQSVASGASVNGVYTRLSLEQHPVLVVDRATGAATLRNFGTAPTVDFDAYSIGSALGALSPAGWSSIAPANSWVEANPTANALSELKTSGSANLAGGASISLGTPFVRPAPASFGQENEDLTFRFAKPTGGFINGQIVYTGIPNNTLTLNVDPTTGAAQLVNGSSFTVSIDAYAITSATQSLRVTNGTWNSLDDQNVSGGNWHEANASTAQLSELLTAGGLTLAPNAKVNLGTPFNSATGLQDLVFRFALTVSDTTGDFDANGNVDGSDFLLWQRSLGSASDAPINNNGDDLGGVTGGDLTRWKTKFGSVITGNTPGFMTGKVVYSPLVATTASAAAVPEPNALALLATASLAGAVLRRRA